MNQGLKKFHKVC